MDDRVAELMTLKIAALDVFCKKQVDLKRPEVIASIITAASGMAVATDKYSSDVTMESLLEAFDSLDNETITNLVGMGPQYVKQNIGYSVDFNDYGGALAAYESDKDNYNRVFSQAQYLYDTKKEKALR